MDLEARINDCLDDLSRKEQIIKEDYNGFKPRGSRSAIIYGLCKIHKPIEDPNDVLLFLPVLSTIGTCTRV